MNREIKFRAWDGKKMIFWTLNDLVSRFNTSDYSGDDKPSIFFTWMQFTGLKDKNGKEIYEGDIVAENELVAGDVYDDGRRIHTVKWQEIESGFWPFADTPGNCGCCASGTDSTSVEVIGNIFENPDLIN